MSGRRVARRVALTPARENTRRSPVIAQKVETKVLHSPLPSSPGRGRVDGQSVVSSEGQQAQTGAFGNPISPTGGVVLALPERCPSRRVDASASSNTFPYTLAGNETKKSEGAKVTGVSARLNVSARGVARLRGRLSERDVAILRQVAELRLMSARQIQAIHFPTEQHDNETAATRARQRVLTRLCRERLLAPLQRRVGGVRAGSSGLVLALGPVGQRVLTVNGPRRRAYEPTLRFFDHTLALAQLAVDLGVAARRGLVELLSFEAEPESWREFAGLGGRRVLRPDAFVMLGAGEYELRWFIEVDRSTESVPTVLRKCQLYADYYQSGTEQAKGGVFPRVCWVVPDEARAERVRAAIEQDRRLPARLFVVTTSEQAVTVLSSHTQVTVNT